MDAYENNRKLLRIAVATFDDIQKLRIAQGNRVVQDHYQRSGIKPGEKIDTENNTKQLKELHKLVKEYEILMAEVLVNMSTRKRQSYWKKGEKGRITDESQFNCIQQYTILLKSEKDAFKTLDKLVLNFSIRTEYLTDICGIGPTLSAYIIAYLDIEKADTIASFWKYCGLDVVEGEGRAMRHTIKRKYVNKDGETKEKNSITFCPFIKAKLIGVLGPCILKAERFPNNVYAQVYRNRRAYEKKACATKVYTSGKMKGKPYTELHIHNRAMRYMVKQFLADLWLEWRRQRGLPITEPYHERKLGMLHHGQTGVELVEKRKRVFESKEMEAGAV